MGVFVRIILTSGAVLSGFALQTATASQKSDEMGRVFMGMVFEIMNEAIKQQRNCIEWDKNGRCLKVRAQDQIPRQTAPPDEPIELPPE